MPTTCVLCVCACWVPAPGPALQAASCFSALAPAHPMSCRCCAVHLQVAAGGDPAGTLDFYAVHGYAIWDEHERDWLVNMFRRPKSDFQVADKPILVGEHWEQVRWCVDVCAHVSCLQLQHTVCAMGGIRVRPPARGTAGACACLVMHSDRRLLCASTARRPCLCTCPQRQHLSSLHLLLRVPPASALFVCLVLPMQVMPWPSTVTVDDYMHLYNTGYAGGWGWAWFNVTETYNYATGASVRRIGEHKCRGTLRAVLSDLPAHVKHQFKDTRGPAAATKPAGGAVVASG
jgi:hypothetical protein